MADYHDGKPQAVGFLVGQVMKASRGQANAALVQAAVRARLDGREAQARGGGRLVEELTRALEDKTFGTRITAEAAAGRA